MKRYRVLLSAPAETEIESAYLFIREDSPDNAAAWRTGLQRAAKSLETLPGRCPTAPENGLFEFEIRQLLHGDYRLLFTIRNSEVVILHVRHGARDWMKGEDVTRPDQTNG